MAQACGTTVAVPSAGGRCEGGETDEAAAVREVREEVGWSLDQCATLLGRPGLNNPQLLEAFPRPPPGGKLPSSCKFPPPLYSPKVVFSFRIHHIFTTTVCPLRNLAAPFPLLRLDSCALQLPWECRGSTTVETGLLFRSHRGGGVCPPLRGRGGTPEPLRVWPKAGKILNENALEDLSRAWRILRVCVSCLKINGTIAHHVLAWFRTSSPANKRIICTKLLDLRFLICNLANERHLPHKNISSSRRFFPSKNILHCFREYNLLLTLSQFRVSTTHRHYYNLICFLLDLFFCQKVLRVLYEINIFGPKRFLSRTLATFGRPHRRPTQGSGDHHL